MLLLDLPHAVDLSPGDGAWVPARLQRREQSVAPPQVYWAVQPLADSAWEPVPGLWDNEKQNSVFVCNVTDTEVSLPPQSAIAGLLPVHVASGHCPSCGHTVTDCYIHDESHGLFPLQEYTCCDSQANASLHAWPSANSVGSGDMVGHVVEDTALLELMVETEIPPDEYYQALRQDMCSRHPEVSPHVLDHLVSLEGLLGVAIISGFSFGAEKARICVVEGPLLGDIISRTGRKPMGDRVQAVRDFAPLRDKQHIQQFLGCTNWLRWSLPVQYPLVAKSLGAYLKPGAVFPAAGLGPGDTEGDKAVRCIKAMAQQAIEAGCLDEAAAIDGSRPLEQVADASGIGWGGTVLQMNEDMTTFKVLLTAGKGFTPTQQAWPPLVAEAYAQLETKRAQRRLLGPMRSICWTDHANVTRAQSSDGIEVKLLRWISEILADGSVIRSLPGRGAQLGDGFSRNPSERDDLLAQRTKDLHGLAGQVRGFSMDEYLSEYEVTGPQPWEITSESVPIPPSVAPITCMAISAGVPPRLTVLYAAGRETASQRVVNETQIHQQVRMALPGYTVQFVRLEGPFPAAEPAAPHCWEDYGRKRLPPPRRDAAARIDLSIGVAHMLRAAARVNADVIIASGKAAFVALALTRPRVLDNVLRAQNVQRTEIGRLAVVWTRLLMVILFDLRWTPKDVMQTYVESVIPGLVLPFTKPSLRTYLVIPATHPLGRAIRAVGRAWSIPCAASIGDVPLYLAAQQPREEAWEHDGICECGKRTYLYPQCPACIEATAKATSPPAETVAAANSAQGRDIWRVDPPHGRWIRCHFVPRSAFFIPRAGAGIPLPHTLHPVRDTFMKFQDGSHSIIRDSWTTGSAEATWTGETHFFVTRFPLPPCPFPSPAGCPPHMDYWVRTVGGRVRRMHVNPRTTLYAPVSRRLSPALLYRQRITRGVDCATMQEFELLDDWQSHGADVPAAWVGHTGICPPRGSCPSGSVEWLPRDSG